MLFCTKSSPLFAFNDWFDANIYFTMGKGLMNGRILYVDLIDNKGPLLYLIYGIAWMFDNTGFFGVYIIQSMFVAISVIYVYRISLIYISNKQIAFLVAICSPAPMLIRRFYTSGGDFGGGGPEEFCRGLMVVSLYYFVIFYAKAKEYKPYHTLIQGALFMCVFLMKFNLVAFWTGFLLSITCELIYKKKFNFLFKHMTMFTLGASIIVMPYLIYGIVTRSLGAFWNTYFLYNNIYIHQNWNPALTALRSLVHIIRLFLGRLDLFLLFIIGLVFVYIVCKTGFIIGYGISLFILFIAVFYTSIIFATIQIPITISFIFGMIALGVLVEKFVKGHKFNMIVMSVAVGLVMSITIGMNNLITYELFLSNKQTAQQQMADIIWQRTRSDSPTLLEIGGLDSGFYTAAGIIPDEPYFFVYNVCHDLYPYPRDAQMRSVMEGRSEFVITRTHEPNSSPNPHEIRRLYDEIHVLQGTGYQSHIFYHLFHIKPEYYFNTLDNP